MLEPWAKIGARFQRTWLCLSVRHNVQGLLQMDLASVLY